MKEKDSIRKLQLRDSSLRFRYDESLDVIKYLRGNLADFGNLAIKRLRSSATRFLRSHADLFGEISSGRLAVIDESPDPQGGLSLALQQYHGANRVYGGSVRFHVTKNGTLDTISNHLFPDLAKVPLEPRITEDRAVNAAQKATKSQGRLESKPEVLVYRYKGSPRLVWEVRLVDTKPGERGAPAHWVVYVDAVNGKVLLYYDNVQTTAVVGNGTGFYSGAGFVNAWSTGTTFQLRDTTRTGAGGPEIITNDEDGASPSEDLDNNWNNLTTAPRDQNQGAEVDAHRYAGDVVDYYQTVHGRNSLNGAGMNLTTVVHLGSNYSNGYWDGSKVNLGDGSGVAATGDNYECSDDWLAHEFTHGYTQFTCALQYLNESGALNEAFSDIFAAFITGDWLVFEDAWLKASAPAWRNMIDPTNGGQWDNSSLATAQASVFAGHCPSHYSVRFTLSWDNGGVHVNSGIINNLFYLLTIGGTHTVSGITVTGIGQSAAEQMLFRCMSVNLVGNPTANFLDFREAMLDACLDLFPTDLVKLSQVKNAFNAVGIGPDIYVRDNLADSGAEPFGGSYLWASPDIINRTAPSTNPALDFANMSDDALWQNIEFGQNNFVYVRLQNRGAANGDVSINVYLSAATTFGTPASWTHIGSLAETGVVPGTVRIAGPLTFPQALIPAPGHYCMIAVVSDGLDPAPDHTLISSVSDYLYFVRNTNNIAYRNMDVVDLVPGLPGVLEFEVKSLPRVRERFDLQIELGAFVPGAKLRIRGPKQALDGAIAQGLKLAERTKNENVYDVLVGRDLVRHQAFLRLNGQVGGPAYGFRNLLVEKPFQLKIDYVLPAEDLFDHPNRRSLHDGYRLAVRQLWNGEAVGAVGIALRRPGHKQKRKARRR